MALVLLATGCTGDGKKESAAARESLQVCQEALGADDIETLDVKLGGDMHTESRPSPDLRRAMLKAARAWNPDSDKNALRDVFPRCVLKWDSGGKVNAVVNGTVRWSTVSLDMARRGVAHWGKVADDIYVAPIGGYGHSMVVPCEVADTASGQRAQLLVETQLWGSGLENADPALRARMLASFGRDMQKLLDCASSPRIPDGLRLPETSLAGPA
ncbi:hypothetical protein [Streptomyces laurentii]|uniref:hypothetical protein n=1 Tax=Streptomyces laurentii TaxID=39478 RepID=UPI003411A867